VPRSKNRVELNLYSPKGPSWPVKKGETHHINEAKLFFNVMKLMGTICYDFQNIKNYKFFKGKITL
jgi:hypothetical protein